MDPAAIAWLRTTAGEHAAARAAQWLAEGAAELPVLDRLRRELSPDQARAVLALLDGRRAAAAKFADAARLYLDRVACSAASRSKYSRTASANFAAAARRPPSSASTARA